jgi:phenylacetate-CoA ligase
MTQAAILPPAVENQAHMFRSHKLRASAPFPSELDPEERMSRDELEALQLSRLQETVRRAYRNVPLYRDKFDAIGIHPNDIKELADLRHLPFTTKEDLRRTYPFGMLAVPKEDLVRIHASSGTTGQPTVVAYTAGDLDRWATIAARSLRASGVRPGHMLHNAYGYGLFTGGLGAHDGATKLGCAVVPMSGGSTLKQVQLIRDFRPDVITCTPTYLLTILEAFKSHGMDPRECSLTVAVLGAEPWTEEMRRTLEDGFNLDALDIYGLSELMGPGVANECIETKDGPHIWEDHFRPEIIDSNTAEVLDDGQEGELVFTSLTKDALPLIRYRTHDITTLLPGTARPAHRRMRKITGRNDDMIILRGVNLFPTQIEEIVLSVDGLSTNFILELTRTGPMDELAVIVEPEPGTSPDLLESAPRVLAREIKTRIGSTLAVRLAEVGTLPRSEGKMKRLRDLRGQAAGTGQTSGTGQTA